MKLTLLTLVVILLNGCAFGQTVDYHSGEFQFDTDRVDQSQATVVFHDQRPYVLSGNKNSNFVGLTRSLAGIPYPTSTQSGRPVTDDMAILMRNTLRKNVSNAKVVAVPHTIKPRDTYLVAERSGGHAPFLLYTLYEWKTDTYTQPVLHYNVELAVLDKNGDAIATERESGKDQLGPNQRAERLSLASATTDIFGSLLNSDRVAQSLNIEHASTPVVENFASNAQPSEAKSRTSCSTIKVLEMKKIGMTNDQIMAACPDAVSAHDSREAAVTAQLADKAMTLQCNTPAGVQYTLSNETGAWAGWINERPEYLRLEMSNGRFVFNDYEDCVGSLYSNMSNSPLAVIDFSRELARSHGRYGGKNGVQCRVSNSLADRGLCRGKIYASPQSHAQSPRIQQSSSSAVSLQEQRLRAATRAQCASLNGHWDPQGRMCL
jgi:hypothetical protein